MLKTTGMKAVVWPPGHLHPRSDLPLILVAGDCQTCGHRQFLGLFYSCQLLKWIKNFSQDISNTSRYFSKI